MQKMISSSTLTLSNLVPNQAPMPETKQNPTTSTIPTDQQHPDSARATRKLRGSSQLNLWSRARAIRSGRKLERPSSVQTRSRDMAESSRSPVRSPDYSSEEERDSERIYYPGFGEGEEKRAWSSHEEDMAVGKSIYMVSDGSGWTAEHSVNAALGQFEHCLVDRGCPVNTHLFSGIDDAERLMEIVQQAAKEGAMLVYTLADENMAASARQACKLWGVPATDILSPITEAIGSHLGVSPSGLPRGAPGRKNALTDEYFKRIEAVEFTIKQDDGALPQNLHKSDIVLAGVSRTGKTPLSIYLAQKGYKVANVPIVMGLELPKTLFEIDPEKVFALTINPLVLQTIRKERAKSLGFGDEVRSSYAEMVCVKEELEYAHKIFTQNPVWPVIEVTGKAIEETAVVILRLYQDRKSRCSMPRISKRY